MTNNRVTQEQKRPDFGAMLAKYGKAEAMRDRKAFSIGAELAGLWSSQESELRELYAENARLRDALDPARMAAPGSPSERPAPENAP